jgi:hypothetical protein
MAEEGPVVASPARGGLPIRVVPYTRLRSRCCARRRRPPGSRAEGSSARTRCGCGATAHSASYRRPPARGPGPPPGSRAIGPGAWGTGPVGTAAGPPSCPPSNPVSSSSSCRCVERSIHACTHNVLFRLVRTAFKFAARGIRPIRVRVRVRAYRPPGLLCAGLERARVAWRRARARETVGEAVDENICGRLEGGGSESSTSASPSGRCQPRC